jgi:hypothetical protein
MVDQKNPSEEAPPVFGEFSQCLSEEFLNHMNHL